MLKAKFIKGFTLLEILVTLFIFAIVSVMMANALNRVISIHERTEYKAKRLRELQMSLLVFSRDIEQAVNRAITDAAGKEASAFIGSPRSIEFTHTGRASIFSHTPQTSLVRVRYHFAEKVWWRSVWPALDQAPQTKTSHRPLLPNVIEGRFEYLDKQGHFHNEWLGTSDLQEPMPRAVRLTIKLNRWGSLSQLYLISADDSKTPAPEVADDAY